MSPRSQPAASKPLTTYAHRRARAPAEDTAPLQIVPSSPLEDMTGKEDITLSEMSRRMQKRARQVTYTQDNYRTASVCDSDNQPGGKDARLPKKPKQLSELTAATRASVYIPNLAHTSVQTNPLLDVDSQSFLHLQNGAITNVTYQTPHLPSEESMLFPVALTSDSPSLEQFSPLPVAQRLVSRTSSRNLKENTTGATRTGKTGHGSLASPFSSRPSSRAASPDCTSKSEARRPRLHTKSRTLSANLNKHVKTSSVDNGLAAVIPNHSPDPQPGSSAPSTVAPVALHARTSSIPIISSNLLGQISAQDWLVPPKVITRSPPPLPDYMHFDDFETDHPSFFLDAPIQASTPPRRRRSATVAYDVRRFGANPSGDSDAEMSDTEGSKQFSVRNTQDTDATIPPVPGSPIQRRKRPRRRTVVHLPSDSIFSSALDFSAYISDEDISGSTLIRRAASQEPVDPPRTHTMADPPRSSVSTGLGHGLESAFSLALPPAEMGANILRHVQSVPVAAAVPSSPAARKPFQPVAGTPSPERDELGDLLSVLGLDDNQSSQPADKFDDSGIAFDQAPITKLGKNKKDEQLQAQRRKRGDTIRASDFARPSVVSFDPAIPESANQTNETGTSTQGRTTRRTRSGTVTLVNAKSPPAPTGSAAGSSASALGGVKGATRVRTEVQRHKRRPMFKLKVDNEPLPPQGSDEEDDILLLKGKERIGC